MTAHLCASCRRPMGDQATICAGCMGHLQIALGDIPALSDELDTSLARITGKVLGQIPGSERPLPYSQTASDALSALRGALVSWVRLVVDERPETVWPEDTLAGMSRWLMNDDRPEWLRHHPAAHEMLKEIWEAVRTAHREIDLRPVRVTFLVGPCPERDPEGVPCPGEVRAYIPTSLDEQALMACVYDDGHQWLPHQWLRAGKRIMDERERRAG